jgi:uncharacterized protein DUF6590
MANRPILTYNRRGCAKPGVNKQTHCIAFSSSAEPMPENSERPKFGEVGMMPGIRILPNSRGERLDRMARIDFSRTYTVDHKIKAYDFGSVDPPFLQRLHDQWIRALSLDITRVLDGGNTRNRARLLVNDDDDDDDDDEDEHDDYNEKDDDPNSNGNEDPSSSYQYRSHPSPSASYVGNSQDRGFLTSYGLPLSGKPAKGTSKYVAHKATVKNSTIGEKLNAINETNEISTLRVNPATPSHAEKPDGTATSSAKATYEELNSGKFISKARKPGTYVVVESVSGAKTQQEHIAEDSQSKAPMSKSKSNPDISTKHWVDKISIADDNSSSKYPSDASMQQPSHKNGSSSNLSDKDSGIDMQSVKMPSSKAVSTGILAQAQLVFMNRSNRSPSIDHRAPTIVTLEDENAQLEESDLQSESDSDCESDTYTIDDPVDLPDDLKLLDERLVTPQRWRARLDPLEEAIVSRSTVKELIELPSNVAQPERGSLLNATQPHMRAVSLEISKSVLLNILEGISILEEAEYSTEGFTSLVVSPDRDHVVAFVHITRSDVEGLIKAVTETNIYVLLEFLRRMGLSQCINTILTRPEGTRMRAAAMTASLFLDLSLVTYCGAHLEEFDEKYLHMRCEEIALTKTLVLRRRSLRCLDEFLNHHQVWVFEQVDVQCTERKYAPLYLLTTPNILADTWGPLWEVTDSIVTEEMDYQPFSSVGQHARTSTSQSADTLWMMKGKPPAELEKLKEKHNASALKSPKGIRRFNLGTGSIIPCDRGATEPEVKGDDGEAFAHWTIDHNEIHAQESHFQDTRNLKLLIGGRTKFRKNDSCQLDPDKLTHFLRQQKISLRYSGTRRRTHNLKIDYIAMINPPFAQLGVSARHKIREGSTLKDRMLSDWINQPERRNPSIVRHRVGIKISACTHNGQRSRLARILGSPTMKNYLESIWYEWPSEECKKRYFQALNDRNISAFEKLYGEQVNWRQALGKAVALCLEPLLRTGCTDQRAFTAIWMPNNRDLYEACFSNIAQKWAGMLQDTPDSAAVGIVVPECLEFICRFTEWESKCRNTMMHDTRFTRCSVLESQLAINDLASIPRGMKVESDTWNIGKLKRQSVFNLGDSGQLKFFWHSAEKCALMKWESPGLLEAGSRIADAILSRPHPEHHRENVVDEKMVTRPIPIWLVPGYSSLGELRY